MHKFHLPFVYVSHLSVLGGTFELNLTVVITDNLEIMSKTFSFALQIAVVREIFQYQRLSSIDPWAGLDGYTSIVSFYFSEAMNNELLLHLSLA